MASMMLQQSIQQLQAIAAVLMCSRRQQNNSIGKSFKKDTHIWKGKDLGDASTAASGNSDSEGSSTSVSLPPGLALPPGLGLESPNYTARAWSRSQADRSTTRSTTDLVASHICGRTAEANWRSNQAKPANASMSDIAALREALDRLDPAEIRTVKSLLDSKIHDAGSCPPTTTRRPFAPFQGTRRSTPQKSAVQNHTAKQIEDLKSSGETLRTFLRDLSLVENGRVLTLRKISKLGLNSSDILETYFSKHGKVERMMVQATIGANKTKDATRLRPAIVGFVLMSTVEDAQAIFKLGGSHVVDGMEISVMPFQSHSVEGTD